MSILEYKCVTPGCWHWQEAEFLYCPHCLHGTCSRFSVKLRAQAEKEIAEAAETERKFHGVDPKTLEAESEKA